MGRFINGQERNEPVQPSTKQVVQTQNVDMDLLSSILANTVSDALSKQIGKINISTGTGSPLIDDFDDSKTQERIAKSMLVERTKKESNFESLGNVKTTKKDEKDVNKTIDLLSDLDD